MDPLSAFGIVCNVIQVVDFGLKTISTFRQIAVRGSTSANLDTEYTVGHLKELSKSLQSSVITPSTNTVVLSVSDKQLVELAQKSEACAKELLLKLQKLKADPKKGKVQAVSKTIELIWKRGELTDLENQLERLRKTLDTRILARLLQAHSTQALQQRKDFNSLDQVAKNIYSRLLDGHKTVIELCKIEHQKTREHVALEAVAIRTEVKMEHNKTRARIRTEAQMITEHLDQQDSRQAELQREGLRERQIEQLKASLWFSTMKYRQEMITDAHEATFGWILAADDDGTISSQESNDGSIPPRESDDGSTSSQESNDSHTAVPSTDAEAAMAGADFSAWLRGGSGVYWINGKAGSGKSTLMSFIVQHHRTRPLLQHGAQANKVIVPCFFFWNTGSQEEKSILGLLRSFLFQCLEQCPALFETFIAALDIGLIPSAVTLQIPAWNVKKLTSVLKALVNTDTVKCQYCFFIDGADELIDDYQDLLRLIRSFAGLTQVKFCISSRPLYEFEREFSGFPSFRLEDLTREDMKSMIRDRLVKHTDFQRLGYSDTRICWELTEKAEGVFLWLVLALNDLEQGMNYMDSADQLKQYLHEIPDELNVMYTRMIEKIPKRYRSQSVRFLEHMLYATANEMGDLTSVLFFTLAEDITLLNIFMGDQDSSEKSIEYNEALPLVGTKCEAMDVHLRTRCASLLNITVVSNFRDAGEGLDQWILPWSISRVSFIHRTLKDFLLESEASVSLITSSKPINQEIIRAQYSALVAIFGMFQMEAATYGTSAYDVFGTTNARLLAQQLVTVFDDSSTIPLETQQLMFGQLDAVLVRSIGAGTRYQLQHYWDLSCRFKVHLVPVNPFGLLAFMGCGRFTRTKLKDYLGRGTEDEREVVTYLLSCVLNGMNRWVNSNGLIHPLLDKYTPPGRLVRDLLAMKANPNGAFDATDTAGLAPFQIWHQYLAVSPSICAHVERDSTDWDQLLEDFIAAGADIHRKVVVGMQYPWLRHSYVGILGQNLERLNFLMSPLGSLQFYLSRDLDLSEKLEQILLSHGAVCTQELLPHKVILRTKMTYENWKTVHLRIQEGDSTAWLDAWARQCQYRLMFEEMCDDHKETPHEIDLKILAILSRAEKIGEFQESDGESASYAKREPASWDNAMCIISLTDPSEPWKRSKRYWDELLSLAHAI